MIITSCLRNDLRHYENGVCSLQRSILARDEEKGIPVSPFLDRWAVAQERDSRKGQLRMKWGCFFALSILLVFSPAAMGQDISGGSPLYSPSNNRTGVGAPSFQAPFLRPPQMPMTSPRGNELFPGRERPGAAVQVPEQPSEFERFVSEFGV